MYNLCLVNSANIGLFVQLIIFNSANIGVLVQLMIFNGANIGVFVQLMIVNIVNIGVFVQLVYRQYECVIVGFSSFHQRWVNFDKTTVDIGLSADAWLEYLTYDCLYLNSR